ncbi:MAG: hypothetical protein HFH32_08240 [Eubacterium sp.]|jgi:hypothetical protein|nr:hypothetical protein [Eubacterium sp.]
MILGGDVFRMGEWLRGRRKWLCGRQKWLRGRGGWLRGRRRGMPALSRLFRFQNIRIPRHPAFSVLVPDAAAVYSPAAKKLPWGLRLPLCVKQSAKGFWYFSTVTSGTGQASTSGCFRACFRALRSAGKELRLET